VVDLANGVNLKAAALRIILDALVSAGHHQISLEDLKVVLSQLGSRITQIDTLPIDARRLAEPALYNTILARCTSVVRRKLVD
jgi:hypothetical protein